MTLIVMKDDDYIDYDYDCFVMIDRPDKQGGCWGRQEEEGGGGWQSRDRQDERSSSFPSHQWL